MLTWIKTQSFQAFGLFSLKVIYRKKNVKNVMKNLQKRNFNLQLLTIFLVSFAFIFARFKPTKTELKRPLTVSSISAKSINEYKASLEFKIYDSLQLNNLGLSKEAFEEGIKGYNYLRSIGKLTNESVISIVDFTLPSSAKRLFVIDLNNFKLLFNTYVAHGRNSGKEYANRFSNSPESNMSSLGFYVTQNTYNGEHGLSLRLQGEEKGINDNAESRAIVIHCANYVSERTIKALGYIGRSLGCPALPTKIAKPIIETIKDGSCFFVFSDSQKYISNSPLLQLAS